MPSLKNYKEMLFGTRNKTVNPALPEAVREVVDRVYGPGYTVELRSGGQPATGAGRVGTNRHNVVPGGAIAGDFVIKDPNGNVLAGKSLGPLRSAWEGTYGSIGLNATTKSFTHLDLIGGKHANSRPLAKGEALHWFYGKPFDLPALSPTRGFSAMLPASSDVIGKRSTQSEVMGLQSALAAAGFNPGKIDGLWGGNTERALKGFQAASGLTPDGLAGSQTIDALASQQVARTTLDPLGTFGPPGMAGAPSGSLPLPQARPAPPPQSFTPPQPDFALPGGPPSFPQSGPPVASGMMDLGPPDFAPAPVAGPPMGSGMMDLGPPDFAPTPVASGPSVGSGRMDLGPSDFAPAQVANPEQAIDAGRVRMAEAATAILSDPNAAPEMISHAQNVVDAISAGRPVMSMPEPPTFGTPGVSVVSAAPIPTQASVSAQPIPEQNPVYSMGAPPLVGPAPDPARFAPEVAFTPPDPLRFAAETPSSVSGPSPSEYSLSAPYGAPEAFPDVPSPDVRMQATMPVDRPLQELLDKRFGPEAMAPASIQPASFAPPPTFGGPIPGMSDAMRFAPAGPPSPPPTSMGGYTPPTPQPFAAPSASVTPAPFDPFAGWETPPPPSATPAPVQSFAPAPPELPMPAPIASAPGSPPPAYSMPPRDVPSLPGVPAISDASMKAWASNMRQQGMKNVTQSGLKRAAMGAGMGSIFGIPGAVIGGGLGFLSAQRAPPEASLDRWEAAMRSGVFGGNGPDRPGPAGTIGPALGDREMTVGTIRDGVLRW